MMRIQALEVESFRGFAEKRRFEFSGVQVLLLYGPNGHGKTSFFDAVEWALTGEIHRYRESTDERNHTRFVGNLVVGRQPKVCLEIMHEGSLLKVRRVGTALATAQTDYGESEVCIEGVLGEPVTGAEAEALLQQLLVQDEWQGKVDVGRTLHLTHVLGQEQMNRFLRGMKGKERYDAVSVLAGTDEFMRYKEMFAETQKALEAKRKEIQAQKKESERALEHASCRATELRAMLGDVSEDEEAWLREYVEQLGGKFGEHEEEQVMMRQVVDVQHKELLKERYAFESGPVPMLEAALNGLSKWKEARETLRDGESQLKRIEQLYELEKKMREILWLKEHYETYAKGSEHQVELSKEIESLLRAIEFHQHAGTRLQHYMNQLERAMRSKTEAEGLLENVMQWDGELLERAFVQEVQMGIRQWLDARVTLEVQVKAVESAKQDATKWADELELIQVMNQKHRDLLVLLQHYVSSVPTLEACPACGTKEVSTEQILHYVKNEQGYMNPELPMIAQMVEESRERLDREEAALDEARQVYGDVQDRLHGLCDDLVKLHQSHFERVRNARSEADYLSKRLDESEYLLVAYKERAEKLGLEPNQVSLPMLTERLTKWEAEAQSLTEEIPEEDRVNLLVAREQWKLRLRTAEEANDQFTARLVALGATAEQMAVFLLADDVEAFLLQKQQEQRDFLTGLSEREQNMLRAMSAVDTLNRLWEVRRLEDELELKIGQIAELAHTEQQLITALSTIKEAINAIPQAIDRLNEQAIDKVSARMQEFFSRLNPHPLYRELDFTKGLRYRNNNLGFLVKGDVEANPSYIFSSAQVNAIALSFFLAMALQQQWSPLQLIAMDDPVQSMDDLNVIALVDLIRVLCEPSGFGKQFIISTHDPTFHKLMRRKFRFLSIGVIEYEGYGEEGPLLRARENEKGTLQYVDRIPRRTMHKLPPDLLLQG